MKVLVITASFPPLPSGGSDYAYRLCEHLLDQGIDLHVVAAKEALAPDRQDMPIYPIMNKWSWKELPPLLQLVKRLEPDVINLHFGGFLYDDHPMITYFPTLAKFVLPKVRIVTLIEAPIGVRAYLKSFPVRASHKLLTQIFRNRKVDYSYGTILRR